MTSVEERLDAAEAEVERLRLRVVEYENAIREQLVARLSDPDEALVEAVALALHGPITADPDPWHDYGCAQLHDGSPNKAARNHIERYEHDARAAIAAVAREVSR